ncbi:MAG: Flp family type IVb pilin [Candidatus Binatia bacterium]
MELLKRLFTQEEGQAIVEYTLILALVVFVIWLAVSEGGVGESANNVFTNVGSVLDKPTP